MEFAAENRLESKPVESARPDTLVRVQKEIVMTETSVRWVTITVIQKPKLVSIRAVGKWISSLKVSNTFRIFYEDFSIFFKGTNASANQGKIETGLIAADDGFMMSNIKVLTNTTKNSEWLLQNVTGGQKTKTKD